jgi:hypothetical protein
MKKNLLLTNACFIIFICLIFSSCQKTSHFPHPSPGHVRLASYNTIGTSTSTVSPTANTSNGNYTFSYDSLNRVSFVTFTTNSLFLSNQDISYTYSNDTIYKVITTLKPNTPIERDTFIVNSQGQITIAFTPNTTTTFQYYESLLTTVITTNNSAKTSVTVTYTSDVGNFLNSTSSVGATNYQTFNYFFDYVNRIGDYYQLMSFTQYGVGIYQYAKLLRSVTQPTQSTNIVYNIDAYSNITQSTVSIISSTGIDTTTVYNLQYENY